MAFTTADGVLYAGPTLAPVASALRWGRGMLVAPYLRSLKHEHPALLVILDRTQARLFRFQRGEVTPLAEFEAAGSDHPVDHMGDAARPTITTSMPSGYPPIRGLVMASPVFGSSV